MYTFLLVFYPFDIFSVFQRKSKFKEEWKKNEAIEKCLKTKSERGIKIYVISRLNLDLK